MAIKKRFPYKSALVACNGGCRASKEDPKCSYGCLACEACVSVCKFGAISINDGGVAEVDEEKCIGCSACKRICPAEAIEGEIKQKHKVLEHKCIGCGLCFEKCKFDAIIIRNRIVKE